MVDDYLGMYETLKIVSDTFNKVKCQPKDIDKQDTEEKKYAAYNVLFISFDIVNSSQYKEKNRESWLKTITSIFTELKEEVFNTLPSASLWRVIGDEIIFIIKIADLSLLSEYVEKVFTIIQGINDRIENDKLSSTEKLSTKDKDIGLQGAAWLASVSDEAKTKNRNINEYDDNVFIIYDNPHKGDIRRVYEFLGNDIDTGFRIKKFTRKGRLVIGFELACFLSEETQINEELYIITYKRLKGIWNNKLYPIIWYHKNLKGDKSFEDSFLFDDAAEDELIQEYFENKNGKNSTLKKEMFTNTYSALHKIVEERKLSEKIERMRGLTNNVSDPKFSFDNQGDIRLQLTAACYDEEQKKILLFKRKQGVHNENKWELGHILAIKNVDNEQCLKKGYKEKYGINIEVMLDCKDSDRQPVPLYLYQYADPKENEIFHRGITVPAIVYKEDKDSIEYSEKEYEKTQWISENEVENLNESECVDDLKKSLMAAFGWFKRREKKKNEPK